MLLLVTGATGKVGQVLLERLLGDPRWAGATIRALCHNRAVAAHPWVETIHGSIADADTVRQAVAGCTHVLHMATVKEDARQAMDVSVKGMFWLLEAFRTSPTARQFLLVSGDCAVGHCFVAYDEPVTETSERRPYPGVYALSKVLEEVMLEQYYIQYGINGCCLRAPWIMEKDDFRHALSFGPDQFGGPDWDTLISPADRARHHAEGKVPVLLDSRGDPLKRNFIHVTDLAEAIVSALDHPRASRQLFNVAMNRPVDYAAIAAHLRASRGLAGVRIRTPFHSNWLDNSKARQLLDWEPGYDPIRLVDAAFAYQRAADDPRKVWYAG
ncbi:nucleoside-diphosphate-sugar epimerase [Hoeflea marina]|uniref:Nucleoside-diphosphate-sugar epimerase n=1 Tax=Hoeflea marina TaxID=274592 RepID=A0A317PPV2_9HYPH|nr:NAD(P)-dependent oxidoreductase [Hoeflea marina]PWW01958.1 nucleoside-diphosphate-sugar epimerase [Hoeflea marina]